MRFKPFVERTVGRVFTDNNDLSVVFVGVDDW